MNHSTFLRNCAFCLTWFFAGSLGVQLAVAQSADRSKILGSAEWKQTMQQLEEWSSVQQIYDKDHMAKLKQQLEKRVAEMPVDQLPAYLNQLKQKLKILQSQEADDVRKWLDETFAVAAPAYAEKIRSELPDIAKLTPAQLQLQLDVFEDKIAKKRRYSEEFAKEREDQAKRIREQNVRDQNARLQSEIAAEVAPRSNYNFSSPNRIRTYTPTPIYYPRLWGGYRW